MTFRRWLRHMLHRKVEQTTEWESDWWGDTFVAVFVAECPRCGYRETLQSHVSGPTGRSADGRFHPNK